MNEAELLRLLGELPDVFRPSDFVEVTGRDARTLTRFIREGVVQRHGRGEYALTPLGRELVKISGKGHGDVYPAGDGTWRYGED